MALEYLLDEKRADLVVFEFLMQVLYCDYELIYVVAAKLLDYCVGTVYLARLVFGDGDFINSIKMSLLFF